MQRTIQTLFKSISQTSLNKWHVLYAIGASEMIDEIPKQIWFMFHSVLQKVAFVEQYFFILKLKRWPFLATDKETLPPTHLHTLHTQTGLNLVFELPSNANSQSVWGWQLLSPFSSTLAVSQTQLQRAHTPSFLRTKQQALSYANPRLHTHIGASAGCCECEGTQAPFWHSGIQKTCTDTFRDKWGAQTRGELLKLTHQDSSFLAFWHARHTCTATPESCISEHLLHRQKLIVLKPPGSDVFFSPDGFYLETCCGKKQFRKTGCDRFFLTLCACCML